MKLSRVRLADQVVDKIQEMIAQGVYKTGDKLPVENELANMFSVSRITIREAFVKLSMMGIVDIRQGEGTFVKELSPESFMKPLLPMLILDEKNLKDIYETRLVIESKTAELAALHINDEESRELLLLHKTMENNFATEDFHQYRSNDYLLHLSIAKYGKNLILHKIVEIIYDLLKYSIDVGTNKEPFIEKSIRYHKQIVEAIINKDSVKAKEYMYEHINGGLEFFSK